jgi:hypothetical protein
MKGRIAPRAKIAVASYRLTAVSASTDAARQHWSLGDQASIAAARSSSCSATPCIQADQVVRTDSGSRPNRFSSLWRIRQHPP